MPTPRVERAILKGTLLDAVQMRMMFTAQLSDSIDILNAPAWDVYVPAIFEDILTAFEPEWITYSIELQYRDGSQWVTYDEHELELAGASAGTGAPNHTAAVLIAKALGVRKMGRKFLSGIVTSHIAGNALDATLLVSFAGALLAYISPQTGVGMSDLTPGILDKTGTFRPFVGGFVSAFLGTMRRRKPGVGI